MAHRRVELLRLLPGVVLRAARRPDGPGRLSRRTDWENDIIVPQSYGFIIPTKIYLLASGDAIVRLSAAHRSLRHAIVCSPQLEVSWCALVA